jgi:hypothetical protein
MARATCQDAGCLIGLVPRRTSPFTAARNCTAAAERPLLAQAFAPVFAQIELRRRRGASWGAGVVPQAPLRETKPQPSGKVSPNFARRQGPTARPQVPTSGGQSRLMGRPRAGACR